MALHFFEAIEKHFGFKVIDEFTGPGKSTDKKDVSTFRNNTIVLKKTGEPDVIDVKLEDLQLYKAVMPGKGSIKSIVDDKIWEMIIRIIIILFVAIFFSAGFLFFFLKKSFTDPLAALEKIIRYISEIF